LPAYRPSIHGATGLLHPLVVREGFIEPNDEPRPGLTIDEDMLADYPGIAGSSPGRKRREPVHEAQRGISRCRYRIYLCYAHQIVLSSDCSAASFENSDCVAVVI
jgi:hypothetical protein